MGARRDALVETAIRLFAEHGYHATSVADIQLAAGLTAGSGALYKHFPSTEALLEAGVESYLDRLAARSADTVDALPPDPRAALEVIAHDVIESMTADEPILRVLLRDLDRYPHLAERVWEGVLASAYAELTRWIERQVADGTAEASDPAATAAILMGALTQLPMLRALTGRTPGDLSPDEFVHAWADVAAGALRIA